MQPNSCCFEQTVEKICWALFSLKKFKVKGRPGDVDATMMQKGGQ